MGPEVDEEGQSTLEDVENLGLYTAEDLKDDQLTVIGYGPRSHLELGFGGVLVYTHQQ